MTSKTKSLTAPVRSAAGRHLEIAPGSSKLGNLDHSWKLKTKKFPYSCTDEEGMLLYHTILENRLSAGFEISTAFGYSAAYVAGALKKNGGHLTTLDCYIEESEETYEYEWDGNWEALLAKTEQTQKAVKAGNLPEGLAMARRLAHDLDYEANVSFCIGVSPQQVAKFLHGQLDFVYIDGGHFGDQPTLDYKAVEPFLSSKCAIFFHDNQDNPSVARAVAACASFLGSDPIVLPTRYQLTLVGRNLDPSFLRGLPSLCMRYRPKNIFFRALRKVKKLVSV